VGNQKCPFCGIASGQEQANLVYDDGRVMAFLPLQLAAYGHVLVVPKEHHETLWDLDEELLTDLMSASKTLTERFRERLGATGFNILHASGADAQQSVPHFHLHLLPRFPFDGIDAWPPLAALNVDRETLSERLRG
jgi:histidine triad (HIT) family protein